jgi:hypothetical protein
MQKCGKTTDSQFLNYTEHLFGRPELKERPREEDGDLFGEGIQQLVPGYDKCLNLYGDYVENQFSVDTERCNKDIFLKII